MKRILFSLVFLFLASSALVSMEGKEEPLLTPEERAESTDHLRTYLYVGATIKSLNLNLDESFSSALSSITQALESSDFESQRGMFEEAHTALFEIGERQEETRALNASRSLGYFPITLRSVVTTIKNKALTTHSPTASAGAAAASSSSS